jgi:hypothetical protein
MVNPKLQITNPKQIPISNDPNSFLVLVIGAYLESGAWDLVLFV